MNTTQQIIDSFSPLDSLDALCNSTSRFTLRFQNRISNIEAPIENHLITINELITFEGDRHWLVQGIYNSNDTEFVFKNSKLIFESIKELKDGLKNIYRELKCTNLIIN